MTQPAAPCLQGAPRVAGRALFDLQGQVALVTGASSGIGLAIADAFAAHGATVVVSSDAAAGCAAAAEQLCATHGAGRAVAMPCDGTDRAQVEALADAVLRRHGRIDTLVCNAGAAPHAGPIASATDADWELTLGLNLRSPLWLTSRVLPAMAERGAGSVVLMSSIAGLRGNQRIGLYGLSKAGLAQLARNLAVEWGPRGVRVNAISPGVIRTPFAQPMLSDAAVMARRIALTPLRRIGEPHEVAGVAVLLASRAGAFISGQNLVVDGGTTVGDGN